MTTSPVLDTDPLDNTASYDELAATLRGTLIRPGEPAYDDARALYNGLIDRFPAAIARCRDTADVITAVTFARTNGIEISVRGGGHHAAGLSVGDNALVVDLSEMRSTTVDPEHHTVRVDPRTGMVWSTGALSVFDPKTEKFQSWAIPGGGDIVRNMDVTRDGNPVTANSLANQVGLVEIK